MMLSPELTFLFGLIVFWFVLYALSRVARLDKHGLDVKPFYFMYKSKALNKTLDKWAKKRRKLWLVLSNISIAFGVGLMVFSVYFLINNLLRFIFPIGGATSISLVIPGLTVRLYWLPYFVIAVVVVVLTHELAHGVIARLEEIPVLSTGVLAVIVLFGAFVEPDEKEFEKASVLSRLRMLAAGSSTNLVTALLVFLLLSGLFAPPAGVLIHEVVPDGPMDEAGFQNWDVILTLDNQTLLTQIDFYEYMKGVKPGETLTLTVLHANQIVEENITTVAAEENKSRAIIGVFQISTYGPNRLGLDQYIGVHLFWTLFWTHLLSLSVAIFNMFPLYPFDGERFLYYPLEKLLGKQKLKLRKMLNVLFLGLLAGNMILSFVRFGLIPI
ncbi:MAG: site-2 protease family protein [Candidatus Bathyarchaeota archaeon]|nr:site-2 protease family protein [Candidatus Bathyarchaeota archaeon]